MEDRGNPSGQTLAGSHHCPSAPFVLTTDSSGGSRARRSGARRSLLSEATTRPQRPAQSRRPGPAPRRHAPRLPVEHGLARAPRLRPPRWEPGSLSCPCTQDPAEPGEGLQPSWAASGMQASTPGSAHTRCPKDPPKLSAGWECGRKKRRGVPDKGPGLQGRE